MSIFGLRDRNNVGSNRIICDPIGLHCSTLDVIEKYDLLSKGVCLCTFWAKYATNTLNKLIIIIKGELKYEERNV